MPARRNSPRRSPGSAAASAADGATSSAGVERLERIPVPVCRRVPGWLSRPANRVRDHAPDLRLVVRRVGLVARLEIEDPASAAHVAAAAAEDLATREPADENQPIRGRNVEVLAASAKRASSRCRSPTLPFAALAWIEPDLPADDEG